MIEWIQNNVASLSVALFMLTLIDGLFLLGLVVNGWGAFALCIYAYSQGFLNPIEMVLPAFLGVFLGEIISFFLVRKFNSPLFNQFESLFVSKKSPTPFFAISSTKYEEYRQKMDGFFKRFGGWSLVLARWTPVAALAPATCALFSLPPRKFLLFSFIGCLFWAVAWIVIVFLTVEGVLVLSYRDWR